MMKNNRESFLIYKSFYEPVRSLTDAQLGRLFRALFEFNINENEQVDGDIAMAFMFFKNQFRLDDVKYAQKCEKNRANASQRKRSVTMDAHKDKEKENEIIKIYNAYPSRCVVKNSSTGKTAKNKDMIKKLLKTMPYKELLRTIKWYIEDCKKSNVYMKNFSTFLNNLPEVPDDYIPTKSTTSTSTKRILQ